MIDNNGFPTDKDLFGAQVVTKTLDTMNGVANSTPAPVDQDTFGAAVVSKTLDYMNNNPSGGFANQSSAYQFNKDVLDSVYTGKGALTNMWG